MSDVRPNAKSSKHRLSSCKKGQHNYGIAQYIGAGIERRVCTTCSTVTFDLTAVDDSLASPLVQTLAMIESPAAKES